MKGISPKFAVSRDVEVEIWPETLPSINIFSKSLTQWRTGPTGIIGLDYMAVNLIMDLDGIPHEERSKVLSDVACLERGYLQVMRR